MLRGKSTVVIPDLKNINLALYARIMWQSLSSEAYLSLVRNENAVILYSPGLHSNTFYK